MNIKRVLGKLGEKIASEFLIKKGYKILETNYYSQFGEIDIIAQKKDLLIFIEVKTRSKNMTNALSSVSATKQKKLHKTAQVYLSKNQKYQEMFTQFDVIGIVPSETNLYQIEHIKDAFRIY